MTTQDVSQLSQLITAGYLGLPSYYTRTGLLRTGMTTKQFQYRWQVVGQVSGACFGDKRRIWNYL